MADADLRKLEREATLNPSDPEVLSKLVHGKIRAGEEIDVYWKIKHTTTGEFCSGRIEPSRYHRQPIFSYEGKTWNDKTKLYKFIKDAINSANTALIAKLKQCEVIEYRTLEFECVSLTEMFEQAEVELLRAEKVALEKKLAEKEKLLAQKEGKLAK